MQKVVLSELASGERVISERMPSVRSIAIGFWIGVGSRDETPAKAGLTHFIEHLLFKDTRSYDARRIAEIFDELGGELNAATSREHTVVYARVPYDQLERAINVMTDMVFVPTFADIDAEREVVLEEIAMVDDAPQDRVHDLVSEAVFGGHPLGRPVLGRSEVISTVSRRTIAGFHESMYQPGNVVVSAAGNVAHDRRVSLVTKAANAR
ncbi:MAG: M16 family metallopeptidase, partial [Gaiellaceae bacterium]